MERNVGKRKYYNTVSFKTIYSSVKEKWWKKKKKKEKRLIMNERGMKGQKGREKS